jgi:molybdate transport system substrate-binding protein
MSAEIRVLALQSPQIVINALAADFEHRTGYRITQLLPPTDMPLHVEQRAAAEVFDAAFLVPALLDRLAAEGRFIGATRTGFLRVPIGAAVRAGAAKPDIGSVAAFRRTLLDATSIAYLAAGTSGPYLQGLFERFGIAATPGVNVVGPLPREIQSHVLFEAAVGTSAAAPDVVRELITFLTGPIAIPVISSSGMERW